MATLENRPNSVMLTPDLFNLPLRKELRRQNLVIDGVDDGNGLASLEARPGYLLSSPFHLLNSKKLDFAVPAGVVLSGGSALYLGFPPGQEEFADELLETAAQIGQGAVWGQDTDCSCKALALWQEASRLNLGRAKKQICLRSLGVPGSAVTMGRVILSSLLGSRHGVTSLGATPGFGDGEKMVCDILDGAEAHLRREHFGRMVGLSELWQLMTGYALVYNVWQKLESTQWNGGRARLLKAIGLAQAKMHVDPTVYSCDSLTMTPEQEAGLAMMWKSCRYRFEEEDFVSLICFLHLTRMVEKREWEENLAIKMIRWEDARKSWVGRLGV